MVNGCGNKCVKYIYWTINFLFFILGAVIIGLSVWLRLDPNFVGKFMSITNTDMSKMPMTSFYYMLYGCMVIGGILLLLGFLGCCGSCTESLCPMGLYFVLVCLLFIVEVVAAALYYFNSASFKNSLVEVFRGEFVAKYNSDPTAKNVIDSIQSSLYCCGGNGCDDYRMYGMMAPATCQCGANPSQVGCAFKIWDSINANIPIVAVVLGIVLLVELFAMIFSCIICGAVKEKRNDVTY